MRAVRRRIIKLKPSFWWLLLLVFAGVDGFQLLEPLKELGSRPFFLICLLPLIGLSFRSLIRIDAWMFVLFICIVASSILGYMIYGVNLRPFGDKNSSTQFISHGLLFFIGFSPLFLRLPIFFHPNFFRRLIVGGLLIHLFFVGIDLFALMASIKRPFADIFLISVDRPFPTGLFSEPSYLSAYVGMLLPVVLFSASGWAVGLISLLVGGLFFLGDVRSFFVVYGVGLLAMMWVRRGMSFGTLASALLIVSSITVVGSHLSLFSVEESLSSAYRLGNSYSYLVYALKNNILLGYGFGSSHFLYTSLDHPDFMMLSQEYYNMLSGTGSRVPIFNMWIRLFVEIGVFQTLLLFSAIMYLIFKRPVSKELKILFFASLSFTLSTDSYIYGMWSMALMLVLSAQPVGRLPRNQFDASTVS